MLTQTKLKHNVKYATQNMCTWYYKLPDQGDASYTDNPRA